MDTLLKVPETLYRLPVKWVMDAGSVLCLIRDPKHSKTKGCKYFFANTKFANLK